MLKNKAARLTSVFQQSERILFDNHSKFFFFSDVHRGDNTWADEFAQNQSIYAHALEYYLNMGFSYVEVGDGDELMKNRQSQHIHTAHAGIFKTLRKFYSQGRFFYIHGNHDIQYQQKEYASRNLTFSYNPYQDKREPLFPDIKVHEGLVFVHQESGGSIFVTHGHQGEYLNDHFWKLSKLLLRYVWRPLQLIGIQNPYRVSNNEHRQKDIELQLLDWIRENNQPLLCGHTHCAHLPKPSQLPYFNTGSCVQPRLITGIEIDRGSIQLIRWRIKPDLNGALFVQREIISGPMPISQYFSTSSQPSLTRQLQDDSEKVSRTLPIEEEIYS